MFLSAYFPSFSVMLLTTNWFPMLKENCILWDSSESSRSSPVEKRLKELMSDALSNTRDDKSDKVFQVLIMSETLAKKMEEISSN